jgi:hypothetical protein
MIVISGRNISKRPLFARLLLMGYWNPSSCLSYQNRFGGTSGATGLANIPSPAALLSR